MYRSSPHCKIYYYLYVLCDIKIFLCEFCPSLSSLFHLLYIYVCNKIERLFSIQ